MGDVDITDLVGVEDEQVRDERMRLWMRSDVRSDRSSIIVVDYRCRGSLLVLVIH